MIYMAVEKAPSAEAVDEGVLQRHFANFDETFFHFCDSELKKINTFYSEKLAEATRKFAALQVELKTALESTATGKSKKSAKKAALPYRKAQVRVFVLLIIFLHS